MLKHIVRVGFITCLLAGPAFAQTAGMVGFQGRLKQNGTPVSGNVTLQFRIFDAQTIGNLIDMDGDGTPEDVVGQDVTERSLTGVVEGLVSTKFGPVHPKAFNGSPRWLQITVNPPSTPLTRLDMATAPATAEQLNVPGTGTAAVSITPSGDVNVGRVGAAGIMSLMNSTGVETIKLRSDFSFNGPSLQMQRNDGSPMAEIGNQSTIGGFLLLSAGDGDGNVYACGDQGDGGGELRIANGQSPNRETIALDGNDSLSAGSITLNNALGNSGVLISGDQPPIVPGFGGQFQLYDRTHSGVNGGLRVNLEASANPGIDLFNSTGQRTLAVKGDEGGYGTTGGDGGSTLSMFNGQAPQATIMLDGNPGRIGIGTPTPQESLHIASGGIKFPDGTVQTTAATTALKPKVEFFDEVAPIVVQTSWTTIASKSITVSGPGKALIIGNAIMTTDNGNGALEQGISLSDNSSPVNSIASDGATRTNMTQYVHTISGAGTYIYYFVVQKTSGDCTLRARQLSVSYFPD